MADTRLPFVGRRYRPDYDRLDTLIDRKNRIRSDGYREDAAITASLVSSLGDIGGRALSDFVSLKGMEKEQQARDAEQARVDAERQRIETHRGILDEGVAEGMSKDMIAQRMENAGLGAESMKFREAMLAEKNQRLTQALSRIQANSDAAGQAAEILNQVQADPSLYPELRPRLVALANKVDPKLAQMVPPNMDGNQASEFMATLQQGIAKAGIEAEALTDFKQGVEAIAAGGNKMAGLEKMRSGYAKALLGADTPEEMDNVRSWAQREFPMMPAEMLNDMATWEPERLAATAGVKANKELSPEQEYYHPDTTPERRAELLKSRSQWAAAGREPDRPSPAERGMTNSQKADAGRRMRQDLERAEADFAKATEPYTTRPTDPLAAANWTPQQIPKQLIDAHEARKRAIQAEYDTAIGYDRGADRHTPEGMVRPGNTSSISVEPGQNDTNLSDIVGGMSGRRTAPVPQPNNASTAPAGTPRGPVQFKLPNGRIATFPNIAALEKFKRENGLN